MSALGLAMVGAHLTQAAAESARPQMAGLFEPGARLECTSVPPEVPPAGPLAVWHVDDDATGADDGSSWEDAFVELQAAFALAQPAEQIWVAQGVYRPDYDPETGKHTQDSTASFTLLNGVAVYGGFEGTESALSERVGLFEGTVLSGDLLDNDGPGFVNLEDNTLHVVDASHTDSTALFDGFHITSGGIGPEIYTGLAGGGLYNYSGEAIIQNCIFSTNAAYGGGAVANDCDGDATYVDCTFRHNYGGIAGAIYNYRSSPSYVRCTFRINTSIHTSGAVFNSQSSAAFYECHFLYNHSKRGGATDNQGAYNTAPLFDHCTFVGNHADQYGGAVHNISDANPTFKDCVFLGNTADWTGGALYSTNAGMVVLSGCFVAGNSANQAGAFYNRYSALLLHNSTVAANLAADIVGGIYNVSSSSSLEIANSVMWGNEDAQGLDEAAQITNEDGYVSIGYSDIQGWTGGWGGLGNSGADPLFVDLDGEDDTVGTPDDDYHISPASPCIDAGDPGYEPGPSEEDLDGEPRVQHCRVDKGVDEYPNHVDCNGNGIDDCQDVLDGSSPDCDEDTVPDECESDSDGDGVINDCDECLDSGLEMTIIVDDCDTGVANIMLGDDGCSMADRIAECADGASNHGEFVSCVAHVSNEWEQRGLIDRWEKGRIQRCAAQAD